MILIMSLSERRRHVFANIYFFMKFWIISLNNKLYVSHKGGYGVGNVLSVIASDDSVTTITVGDAPDEMVIDNDNNLWVVCEGETWPGETAGKIVKVDTATDMVVTTFDFATTEHPKVITYESGKLYYYIDEAIYKMNETDSTLPTTAIISQALTEGDLAVKNGKLFGTRADYNTGDSELII